MIFHYLTNLQVSRNGTLPFSSKNMASIKINAHAYDQLSFRTSTYSWYQTACIDLQKKVLKSCHVNSELEIFTMRTKILQCLSPIFGLFRYSLANDKKKNSIL